MIGILCPVLGRPQNVSPFLESTKNTTSEYRVYFICSPNDRREIEACKATDAEVHVVTWQPRHADFQKKINWTFNETDEEWVFQAADDIRFSPGWDTQAFLAARRRDAQVIGTNDLGNPLVKRGRHSTHTLFRRSYIEDYGGTFDGSGKVFSELYDHQWCDSEFIQTAIHRHVFAFAKNSIVEHLHPHWGKTEMDSTYKKATHHTKDDMLLYQKRFKLLQEQVKLERKARAAVG